MTTIVKFLLKYLFWILSEFLWFKSCVMRMMWSFVWSLKLIDNVNILPAIQIYIPEVHLQRAWYFLLVPALHFVYTRITSISAALLYDIKYEASMIELTKKKYVS